MNLGRHLVRSRGVFRHFSHSSKVCYPGKFLSDSYDCKDAWTKRLESPIISKVNADDLLFEMDKRYTQDKVVSAIDVDLFVHRVDSVESVEEVEELVHRLRKSPATSSTLPSTLHAVNRLYIETGRFDDLLRLLNDRMNYGLFLDNYLSNLLMDKFLAEENYKNVAKIASLHMLQEDFGPPLTQLYCLYGTLKYLETPPSEPWEPEPAPDPRETSREETKIKVKFLRQPGFDDHFDLTNENHILGKILALVSMNLVEVSDEVFKRSLELYGWALYDKWEKVDNMLRMASSKQWKYSSEVIAKVLELAESQLKVIESSETKSLPPPKLKRYPGMNLDPVSVSKLFAFLNRPDYSKVIPQVITALKGEQISKTDLPIIPTAEKLLKEAVAKYEQSIVDEQLKTYEEWEQVRSDVLTEQIRQYRNEQRLMEIEKQKKELQEREEVIFFFDNEEEWMMRQPPAVRVYKMRFKGKYRPPKQIEDTTYVPPTI